MSDILSSAYEQPLRAARAHKHGGGKVVGYVSTAVPLEIIEASGSMPVLIRGDVDRHTTLADEWMEEQFDPMARSIFDMALAGELEFLDLLIVPRVADSFMRLYLYLREVERLGLCKRLPKLYQFDLLQSKLPSTPQYNLERFAELSATLGEVSGTAVTNDSLRRAVARSNENRAALRSLIALRAKGIVKGSAVLRAIGARYALPFQDHTQLLRSLAVGSPSSTGKRVVVAGNAQDNALLYEYLEAQGFSVVGDYHWMGDNCCRIDIELSGGDPLDAIARHYLDHSLSSRRFPLPSEEVSQVAKEAGARGIVFYLFAAEEALSWDVPNQVHAAESAGLATLVLENQTYRPCIDDSAQQKVDRFAAKVSS